MSDPRFAGAGPKSTPTGGQDPYLATGAKVMLESARRAMDEYAREIFDLWFGGTAPAEVVFDDVRWASYMRAEPNLQQQINTRLTEHAGQLRSQVDAGPGRVFGMLNLNFHAEVGSKSGEYRTGYDVLHGSNRAAGDFVITGQYNTIRPGPPGTGYTVRYENVAFVFNDIVDINKRWSADVTLGRVATNMARSLGTPPPRDYTLRIKWRAEQPIKIEIGAEQRSGRPMPPLPTFRNR